MFYLNVWFIVNLFKLNLLVWFSDSKKIWTLKFWPIFKYFKQVQVQNCYLAATQLHTWCVQTGIFIDCFSFPFSEVHLECFTCVHLFFALLRFQKQTFWNHIFNYNHTLHGQLCNLLHLLLFREFFQMFLLIIPCVLATIHLPHWLQWVPLSNTDYPKLVKCPCSVLFKHGECSS